MPLLVACSIWEDYNLYSLGIVPVVELKMLVRMFCISACREPLADSAALPPVYDYTGSVSASKNLCMKYGICWDYLQRSGRDPQTINFQC